MPQKNPLRHTSHDALTQEQIERSDRADRAGLTYASTPAAEIFGRNSSRKAIEVQATNPRAYRAKKLEYQQQLGEIATPLPQVPE